MGDLYRLGDEFVMDPDDWLDQLLASGALVEVTIDNEAAAKALDPFMVHPFEVETAAIRTVAAALRDTE